MSAPDNKPRCAWVSGGNPLYHSYHDKEWGVPVRDDTLLFEFLILEGAQAGLSWATVLNKRDNYRRAFAGFAPEKVARFSPQKIESLLQNKGLIRNRLKMNAAVSNAACFLETVGEFGNFHSYAWQFIGGHPQQGKHPGAVSSPEAEAFAKDLKRRGFKFVGSTIMYAYMQAVGMINDHDTGCYRRRECEALS